MQPTSTPYDDKFFQDMTTWAKDSAAEVVPIVRALFPEAQRVIDVGCGTGAWGLAMSRHGIPQVLGIDGAYALPGPDGIDFRAVDLNENLPDLGVFDLAICLEVAEHLPQERAESFIADLAALAPAVLFSAASCGQGGTDHKNEQWLSFWIELFDKQGFECLDMVRPLIRYNEQVAWFYRQNMVLMLRKPVAEKFKADLRLTGHAGANFEYVARAHLEALQTAPGAEPLSTLTFRAATAEYKKIVGRRVLQQFPALRGIVRKIRQA